MDKKIGFIGLGNMGEPMATNLVKAGFDLTVYDIRPEPLRTLEKLGAKVARSTQEVGERCNIIETIVVNDAQVEEVILGKDGGGVLAGARPGSIIVIHSTVHPKTCQRIAALAKDKGVGVLDTAVSGAEAGARAGTLTLMVGGDPALLEICRPVFNVLGKQIFHMGEVGMGEVAKLVNNLMAIVNMQSTREGLRLARLAGIDEQKMLEVVKVSTGNSWAVQTWEAMRQVAQNYTTGPKGMAQVGYKDISLAVTVGHDVGVSLPVAALVSQLMEQLFQKEE
ncbi:MAG: NAD(P)-dependent oxidoreductase [Deltaproteobacteria bacterium]|nr:NAD(P)-dependent oxidoreductase [Deltaproteobacteria bacterium]